MNCPACQNKMTTQKISQIALDICTHGCGGIWFDQFEFKKFNEAHEPDPDAEITLNLPKVPVSKTTDLMGCPRCPNKQIRMHRKFASPKRAVTIDECPNCAGIWLDLGELQILRSEYKTEQEREKAAEKMIDDLFGHKLKEEAAKSQAQTEKGLRKALRFLSPSYYASKN